jgi:tripartite-type tricarboxylate transporter receptor subunit TctC
MGANYDAVALRRRSKSARAGEKNMTLIRRRFLSLAGAAAAAPAFSQAAWSQAYPNRQIRVMVMLAAGGGTDFLARLTGEFVSRGLGQQMVVENRTGAGGTIGIESVMKSPADGYTVLFSNDNIASAPQILRVGGDYLSTRSSASARSRNSSMQ